MLRLSIPIGFLCIILTSTISAQKSDSSAILTYSNFLQWVNEYHPIAQQIRLLRDRADRQLQFAKGNFDPQLGGQWDYKAFDGKNYYTLLHSYLKVPTWIGVGVEAGYAHAAGYNLNPENKLPESGQAYLGVNVPLLQGLITDERRTAVQQARVLQDQSEADIRAQLNDLLYESALAYWDWALAFNEQQILSQYRSQARVRFEAIREAYRAGDRPAVDTLEAFLRIQDRNLGWREAFLRLQKAQLGLSNFLWDAEQNPLLVTNESMPEMPQQWALQAIDSTQLEQWLDQAAQAHPALMGYDFQLKQLELEERLKRNKILPKLEFKYNFLANEHVDFVTGNAFVENYKLGVKLSMPILLRQERAGLQLTLIKQKETTFKRSQKAVEIGNKIRAAYIEVNALVELLDQAESMLANYQELLAVEQEKFSLGESSVFLLNAREDKVIEAQLKLLYVRLKYLRAQTTLQWALANI